MEGVAPCTRKNGEAMKLLYGEVCEVDIVD
jgi:hypothetical protein